MCCIFDLGCKMDAIGMTDVVYCSKGDCRATHRTQRAFRFDCCDEIKATDRKTKQPPHNTFTFEYIALLMRCRLVGFFFSSLFVVLSFSLIRLPISPMRAFVSGFKCVPNGDCQININYDFIVRNSLLDPDFVQYSIYN